MLLAALAHGLLGGALRASGTWPASDGPPRTGLEVVGILTLTDPPPTAAPAVPSPPPARAAARADRLVGVAVPAPVAASAPAGEADAAAEAASPPIAAAASVLAAAEAATVPTDAETARSAHPPAGVRAGAAPATPDALAPTADPALPAPAVSPDAGVAAGLAVPHAAAEGAEPALPPSPGAPPFEWPPSTRVTYDLTGWYRGEVQGRAQVEWVREGDRYAVRLEVAVGLPVAPLMSRRMSSEGRLTPQGLAPERYDEVTEVVLRDPRRVSMAFTPQRARLADGRELPVPPAVQDTASQFIQMAYRFATEPGLADAGRVLELPLALPRRIDVWTYDVLGAGPLATPFGTLTAVQVRPRPPADRRDLLTAEAWFAPGLRWLPVRIRIRQDADTHVDLLIARLPDLLAREAEGAVDRSRTAPPPGLQRDPADPAPMR